MDWSMAFWILLVGLLFMSIFALYLWYVKSLIKIAKKLGIKDNLWFLYVPFLREYILCKMARLNLFFFVIHTILSIIYSGMIYLEIVNPMKTIFGLVVILISFIWCYKIVKHFKHCWLWAFPILIFPIWAMRSQEVIFKEEKPEKKISAKEIEKLESKDSENFFFMLKALGIIVGIVILLVVIRNIFF